MTISVIIPTFRRPAELARCLEAMKKQNRLPDEVLMTVRDIDQETRQFLDSFDPAPINLRIVAVRETGVIAAMNAALAVAAGEIIALTDDDAAPWPDWLERIAAHFADPSLAGVGGRDWQYYHGKLHLDGRPTVCGQLSWYGRVSAGHHLAEPGPAYDVVVLKGVNSAYRAALLKPIGFDTRLAGAGAQVHWELSLGLALRRAGWKLVFDPAVAVDHFPAARFDEDQRRVFNRVAQQNAVANETLILVEHFRGMQRVAFLSWALLIGTKASPGLVQLIRSLLRGQAHPGSLWWATQIGRWRGIEMRFGASGGPASVPPRASFT
jgi:GT2 family glycosyltransferase